MDSKPSQNAQSLQIHFCSAQKTSNIFHHQLILNISISDRPIECICLEKAFGQLLRRWMMVLLLKKESMMQQQHQQSGPLRPPRNIILSILLAPVLFLSTLLANLNHLSILNSLENMIDSGASKLFNSLLGFNLEFEVHKNGMD